MVKSWKRKCSFLSFLGSLFSSSVGTVSLWNCWLLYLKRKKCGGSGTSDGLCGWRYVFINEITLMFFCAALWGCHRSVVSFVGTTLIYPPSPFLSLSLWLSLSLSLSPTLSCFSFSGSYQSWSFAHICSLLSLQLKVTLFSSSSACLWQKGIMGKAWLSFV